ncbi:STAS domain-containing protein [Actinoplanes sp. GCM10030250]|uniref:STAS domain-containing protein n=1 Tax=Actinoplanes sp. GCM10030250 TaxID=3273376 RepID=UPI00361316F5
MNGPFTVRKYDEGDGVVRIAIDGEIDGDSSEALSLIIVNATEQSGIEALVIDLARVPFLAAAGIRSLLEGRRAALRCGYSYYVVNPQATVLDTLIAAGTAGSLLSPTTELRAHPQARSGLITR